MTKVIEEGHVEAALLERAQCLKRIAEEGMVEVAAEEAEYQALVLGSAAGSTKARLALAAWLLREVSETGGLRDNRSLAEARNLLDAVCYHHDRSLAVKL